MSEWTGYADRCGRCGDPGGRAVEVDGVTVYLCETCHGVVRSANAGKL